MSAISQIKDVLYGHSRVGIGVTATLGIAALVFGILGQCEIGIFRSIGITNSQIMIGVSVLPLTIICYMSYQRYLRTTLDGFTNYYKDRFDTNTLQAGLEASTDDEQRQYINPQLFTYIQTTLNNLDLDAPTQFSLSPPNKPDRIFMTKRQILASLWKSERSISMDNFYFGDDKVEDYKFSLPCNERAKIELLLL